MTDTLLAGQEGAAENGAEEGAGASSGANGAEGQAGGAEGAGGGQSGSEGASGAGGDDWRARLSGGDEKLLGYLGRLPSEKAVVERLKKHEDDLKAGKYLKPLPENATDKEIAEYRAQNGVPEKAEGYLDKLPDGLVVGDDDRPAVNTFIEAMHALHAPRPIVEAALGAYYKLAEQQQADEVDRIAEAKETSILALRDEWGADYKRNLNAVDSFLKTLPEDVAAALSGGTDADGIPLANSAPVIKWLAAQALEANPLSTVVPGAGANQASAVQDEIAKLEAMMQDRKSEYWTGPNSDKNRARLRELYEAKEKLKGQ